MCGRLKRRNCRMFESSLVAVFLLLGTIGCSKDDGGEIVPPIPGKEQAWKELPDTVGMDPSLDFVTHFTAIGGKTVRNFSMLYDPQEKVSYWVAYPLHASYLGTSGRTEAWAYDPQIPEDDQLDLYRSYGTGIYDRGHQIPSADRTANDPANAQTFYYTNMTPQNSTLNRDLWANLEAWVRAKRCADTLYVVTGCVIRTVDDPVVRYVTKDGVRGAIPKAYFKVLLRTKSGNTGALPTDATAKCVGFWLENTAPTPNADDEYPVTKSIAYTVAQIEELTGYTFFPSISPAVKATLNPYLDWGLKDE